MSLLGQGDNSSFVLLRSGGIFLKLTYGKVTHPFSFITLKIKTRES